MAHGRVSQAVDSDPSGVFGGAITLIGAGISLLVAFGVTLTADQQVAILGFATAAGPFVTAYLIRRKAWSPQAHWQELSDVVVDLEEESYNAVAADVYPPVAEVEVGGTPPRAPEET